MDSIVSSLPVSFYDPLHHRIHLPDKRFVPGSLIIKVHTVDKQKRRIHRIIKGGVSSLRGKDSASASPFMNCKGSENLLCRFILTGRNAYARKSDHGISSQAGGITKKEAALHVSNVMLVVDGKATRVGFKMDGDKKVRYAKSTGEVID